MFRFRWSRIPAVILIAAMTAFCMAACGSGHAQREESQPETAAADTIQTETQEQDTETLAPETETEKEAAAGIANPFSEYETLGAAERAAGVEIELPEGPEGYPVTCYRAAKEIGLLEIVYLDGSANSADSKEAYRIRKQAGEADISGDYTEYSELTEQEMEGGCLVTLKGNDGAVYCAVWTDDGYSYAISIDMDGNGMPAYDVLTLVSKIK